MKKFEASIPAAGGFFGGLLCGVGIGVALMYILDPDKGSERRDLIKGKASSLGHDGLEWAQGTFAKADKAVSKSSIPTSFQSI